MGNIVKTCLLIYTFIFFITRWCSCYQNNSPNNSSLRCIPSERAALLSFKHNLTYVDKNVSFSWKGGECCEWRSVSCDNTTGHVLELDLGGDGAHIMLKMEKLDSLVYLLQLKQLEHLDLSFNNFTYSSIPRFMGSMKQLRYLDLSFSSLSGLIPYELGNLTNLEFLGLSSNMLIGEIPSSLGKLSNLTNLKISYNNLNSIAPSLTFPTKLESLDLSNNRLSGKIPTSIGKLSKLQSLDISNNLLESTILSEPHFANFSSLINLEIFNTMLTLNLSSDWVPPFQLQDFSADNCKINGQFPPWLQTQKNLSSLSLSNANISGIMPSWFHTMQQLKYVFLSGNNLSGSPIFPINFQEIYINNNTFSVLFLSNGSKLEVYRSADRIDLSNNILYGPIPESFGHIMPILTELDLSYNKIDGHIPNSLCQCTFLFRLDLQDNNLSGVIPNCLGNGMPNLEFLGLSNNQLRGSIPGSLCQLTSLLGLEIRNNSLSGVIPNCLGNITDLSFLSLSHNKLTGHIPCFNSRDFNYSQPESYSSLSYLQLNDNMLSGEPPSCLSDISNLILLDIGGNQLSGKMLNWFSAEKLKELVLFRLRGNMFSGPIPKVICSLPHLKIIDLGHNHFTGSIPRCLSNLTAMTSSTNMTSLDMFWDDDSGVTPTDVSEVIQGIEREYTGTLPYLVDIDLSCNNLVGSIPDDITKITGLMSLNLSYNQLRGIIPENIGGLKSLISLDLSKNNLGGSIPTSIGQIYTLSHLNLSYNNLSGPIPTGNQLQALSDQASIYAGNPHLCGDFLPMKCKGKVDEQDKGRSNKGKDNNKEKLEKMGLVLVVMSGFATGFWGVVGGLALNRRWRHAVFRRVDDCYNWLYVILVLKMRVLKAKINRR